MSQAEQVMATVLEAWGNADMGPVLNALDENVVWKSGAASEADAFGFGGVYRGKESVIELLSTLSTRYFFRKYVPKEIISKGEIVWGLFEVHGSFVAPGGSIRERKNIVFETAFRWRIRDGKILEAQSFFDTASLLIQQGALHAHTSRTSLSLVR